MSSLRYAVEDRKTDAVTHLALARSQNTGNGILGVTKDKSESETKMFASLFLYDKKFRNFLSYKKTLREDAQGRV